MLREPERYKDKIREYVLKYGQAAAAFAEAGSDSDCSDDDD